MEEKDLEQIVLQGLEIESIEKEKASERKALTRKHGLKPEDAKYSQGTQGQTRDIVAEKLGISGRHWERMKYVYYHKEDLTEEEYNNWRNGKSSTSKLYTQLSKSHKYTVLELVQKYLSQKRGVKHNTQANYNFVVNIIKKDPFGAKRIDKVKLSDAKEWLIKLQDDGKGYSSIHSIRGVVRPAFQLAVDDDLIHKNPFEFQLATVVVNKSVTREAITRKQERDFLRFIKEDKHFSQYYDAIYILFHTGLRISEFVGLTIKDIEFDKERIKVDHQLQRTRRMEYVIETPKTEKGERYVPMKDDVADCFRRIIENRKKPKVEPMIDGYVGFLCLDKNDMPMVALHWEKYFQHIREKYNSIYKVQMPCITPHVCRHTFCSNMAKSGMNPKMLQYIMGHSDIGVTLNTYTHLQFDDALEEMKKVCNE